MGGGAIRAAARVAGITVANGGLRGITAEHHPVFSATRRAASAHPAEDVKLVGTTQSQTGLQKTSSEMDEFVIIGEEGETVVSGGDRMPRVVFDGAPTLQEAKEATSELTVALEKVYLSSPNPEVIENRACVTNGNAVGTALPAHAIKAFEFLQESSGAQNVVASIACDPNVWNAVLQNQELQKFIQSQSTCLTCSDTDQSEKSIDVASEYGESQPNSGVTDIIQKVKITVVDMMSSLSDYFQNIFEGQGRNRILANSNGSASADTVMEASFMGLAVMAIMVILLKRA